MANCARAYGKKRDKTLLYEQEGAVTLKPYSLDPKWHIWDTYIPRLVCSKGQTEDFIVVPRENAVLKPWTETSKGMPYTVIDEACYVLSVVIEAEKFPLTFAVNFMDNKAVGRYTGTANGVVFESGTRVYSHKTVTFCATDASLVCFTFLSRQVPVYCCIDIKRKEPTLRRSRKAVQGDFCFTE